MYSLEPAAAMVMIWAKPMYSSGMASRLLRSLDMSGGEALCKRCEASCAWYGEVIKNRKYFMTKLAGAYVENSGQCQVLALAAGMSPIALELIEGWGERIVKSIETDIMGMYSSPGHDNIIIMEYLLPCSEIREERRYIPRNEFSIIKNYCDLPHIQCYTKEALSDMLSLQGGTIEGHFTMREMERARIGCQRYFKGPGDWWIECLAARV